MSSRQRIEMQVVILVHTAHSLCYGTRPAQSELCYHCVTTAARSAGRILEGGIHRKTLAWHADHHVGMHSVNLSSLIRNLLYRKLFVASELWNAGSAGCITTGTECSAVALLPKVGGNRNKFVIILRSLILIWSKIKGWVWDMLQLKNRCVMLCISIYQHLSRPLIKCIFVC